MKIGIILYLSDAQFEDAVIESLISPDLPDLYLEFRAISQISLENHLSGLVEDGTRRIILHDRANLELKCETNHLENLISLNIQLPHASGVRAEVVRALRNFENKEEPIRQVRKLSNLIVVTGATSSPGITTVTLNLAHELSASQPVNLIDMDPRRSDLAFMLGGRRDESSTRLSERLSISRSEVAETKLNLVDCGSAPDLSSAISDRRSATRKFSDLIESAARVVFVTQPENNVMFELERFVEAQRSKIMTAEPIFLINKLGDSQRQRSIYRRCQARIGGGIILSAPNDFGSLERAKGQYSPIADVAPRSRLRRSIRELATYLIQ